MKLLSTVFAILVLSLGVLGSASAATECKGKSKTACSANSNCSWVKGFTRKDGAKVSAHCRGGKGALKAKAKKKKDDAKSKAKSKKDTAKNKVKAKAKSKKDAAKAKAKSKKDKAKKKAKSK